MRVRTAQDRDVNETLRILDISENLALQLQTQLQAWEHERDGQEVLVNERFLLDSDVFAKCGVGAEKFSSLGVWSRDVLLHAHYIKDAQNFGRPDRLARNLARGPPLLISVGKLAKGGTFFRTADRRFLVKGISSDEAEAIDSWADKDLLEEEYGTCKTFSSATRLLPHILRFKDGTGQTYLVMQNETMRLQELFGNSWEISKSFDVKPLPSVSDDLVPFLTELETCKIGKDGKAGCELLNWKGWGTIRNQLLTDVRFLDKADVVDYSFFIHILDRKNSQQEMLLDESSVEQELPPGCILRPERDKAICFGIIDYATYYSFGRTLESVYKGDKFYHYGSKFLQAFDCLGDLSIKGCHLYGDLTLLKNANSPHTRYLNYLRSETFRTQYECKARAPIMKWVAVAGANPMIVNRPSPPITQPFTEMENSNSSWVDRERNIVPHIDVVSNLISNSILVNEHFEKYMNQAHNSSMSEARVEKLYGKGTRPLETWRLEKCKEGIMKFSTGAGWFFQSDREHVKDIVWTPATQSVIAIRAKPVGSDFDDKLTEMRFKECFLKATKFRCSPKTGSKVMFDYKTRFGAFEILMVEADKYSADFKPWSKERSWRERERRSE